jgi:BirA family biotin operon repressor/biotin-[acetyl-CoA-carboxylase] ligase
MQRISVPGYATVELHDELSSTMDEVRKFMQTRAPVLVVARTQSAGRGRQGRSWSSTEGAFMGSFLFPTVCKTAELRGYSLMVGVAVAEGLRSLGVELRLKWPNDLVVWDRSLAAVQGGAGGALLRKLGGILVEVEERSAQRMVVVGVGINVQGRPAAVPHAAAVSDLATAVPSLERVIQALGGALLSAHTDFEQLGGFAHFRSRWIELSSLSPGRAWMTVDLGAAAPAAEGARSNLSVVRGIYKGVDSSGALLLSVEGRERVLHSGHVLEVSELPSSEGCCG